jgi:protoporphyrinogen oxidase
VGETVDTVIIGAGPAGLAAAYRLTETDRTVRVFEALGDVGGRTRSATVAGERINTAAMFVYVGTESHALCHELGIATVPVTPPSFGVAQNGRTVLAQDDAGLVDALNLPQDASVELRKVLRDIRDEYDSFTDSGGLSSRSEQLAGISFAEHLGDLHPDIDGILRNLVQGGSTATPEVLSAQYGLRYCSSYIVRAAGHREYIPTGMQTISQRLANHLAPNVLALNTAVTSVTPTTDGYAISLTSKAGADSIAATNVVFAVPSPLVMELAPWLPEWKTAALQRVKPNATVTMAIVLDSSGKTNWDDIFVISAADAAFNLVLQPRSGADRVPSEHGRTTMMCYLSSDDEAARDTDDEATVQRWLDDFYAVVPDARGRVLDTLLTRWPYCFSHVAPDRDDVIDDVRRSINGMHFAGDYSSSTAGSHGAIAEGFRVAHELSLVTLAD